jgi:hypothetical protein
MSAHAKRELMGAQRTIIRRRCTSQMWLRSCLLGLSISYSWSGQPSRAAIANSDESQHRRRNASGWLASLMGVDSLRARPASSASTFEMETARFARGSFASDDAKETGFQVQDRVPSSVRRWR